MSRSLKAHILLLLITLIWGVSFVVIKFALTNISPLFFNAVRMSLAAVILALVFRRDLRKFTKASLLYGVILGIFLGVGNEFQTVGLKYTTASKSAFLTGISVVLVPVFLTLFWRRKISRWSATGVGFAFIGLYLLTIPGSVATFNLRGLNPGDLLTLLAAVVFAFHIIYMGHATEAHSWRQIVTIQTAFSAILMIAALPIEGKIWVIWSGGVIAGIILTGFFSLALAFAIQAWAQQFTPATHTALIFSLEPVFASITSFIFLGERLGGRAVLGGTLILVGVLISEEKGTTESLAVAPDHAAVPQTAMEAPVPGKRM